MAVRGSGYLTDGIQREKLFNWRLSAWQQCLKQASGRAGADAPEVAKCLNHAPSLVCARCAGAAHASSAAAESTTMRIKRVTTGEATCARHCYCRVFSGEIVRKTTG